MRRMLFFFLLPLFASAVAQQPEKLNSSEIYKEIQQLNFLGSALYIAAHPDDENTRLISYLSNEVHARTAYLSLTRGDGGQNLIGPELRELLGVIRSQELLAARRIDGGQQFFTRANDFGYSKHPEETLNIWNKEKILSDVVWTIRKFRPDIIINRFHHESAGETHGHHTSSAMLSLEAFELSGKESAYPKQLEKVEAWNPKKVFFNTSPWFYGSQEAFEAADKSKFVQLDIGTYFPLLGLSNTEIASLSRSQHQSQGFGSTGTRGSEAEYLELIGGSHPRNSPQLFEGINTTWSRIKGGEEIGRILHEVEESYDFQNPAASIPQLVEAYQLIQELEDEHWKHIKTAEIKHIIAAAAGLYLEAVTNTPIITPGEEILLNIEAINRSHENLELASLEILPLKKTLTPAVPLKFNEGWQQEVPIQVPLGTDYTTPYWLQEESSLGMYKVADPTLIGLPETPRQFKVTFHLDFDGTLIPFSREISYKRNDPAKGETYRPFEIVPPVSARFSNSVMVFPSEEQRQVMVKLTSAAENLNGSLSLEHPSSWKVHPAAFNFNLPEKGEEKTFSFTLTPPSGQEEATLKPLVQLENGTYSNETVIIDYEHIPTQTLVLPAEAEVVKLDIETKGEVVGYIHGAGDVVPQALTQMGYRVVTLSPENISARNLQRFDAVVLGIRAFNVVPELRYKQKELFEYVKNGGNLIVQYNTSRGLVTDKLAPHSLTLSSNRVTDEHAEVGFLAPDHPVLNIPNKITSKDFEGWVQERGLYFPNDWAKEFTPILSMNDKGESEKQGSLLVAPFGKGHYIYTGLSFFREFPAGVPGAFRLFANLVSLGHGEGNNDKKAEMRSTPAKPNRDSSKNQ